MSVKKKENQWLKLNQTNQIAHLFAYIYYIY